MSEPLVTPNPGEKISDRDFVRLVNRAQAIALYLTSLDIPQDVKDELEAANERFKAAMSRKLRRR